MKPLVEFFKASGEVLSILRFEKNNQKRVRLLAILKAIHMGVAEGKAFDMFGEFYSPEWILEQKSQADENNLKVLERYEVVLWAGVEEIFRLSTAGDWDELQDLADTLHCLGDAIQNKHGWDEPGFWACYLLPYEKRWNKMLFSRYKR
ncbi:hypothetical protein [Chitiniphilus eburneus]|uniref:Uncharacterized protein n=1 Tax=Chitiniphilus eburneus TaxID=2571148 RepID=A0A4U0PGE6_9NEIS|nr:hypothetical protein [Chitiniphilus eburneus]TJZ66849.1 hypothetical protein FAZ21_16835 [Chitiniphilus eburneus]